MFRSSSQPTLSFTSLRCDIPTSWKIITSNRSEMALNALTAGYRKVPKVTTEPSLLSSWQGGAGDSLRPMWKAGWWQRGKYYNYKKEPVYESTNKKLLWDFKLQTDKPDIVVLDEIERRCLIYWCFLSIWHQSERQRENEKKTENYQSINQSINQTIYLRECVGWGCPDHPSKRLMYKTHDNKNTKLIKIQYIWIKNNLKRSEMYENK